MARIVLFVGFPESLILFRGPLIRALVDAGHDVVAMAPGGAAQIQSELAGMGAQYIPVRMERTGLNPLKDIVSLLSLVRIFRKVRPDFLMLFTIKPVIYGSIAARLSGCTRVYPMITGLGYVFTDGHSVGKRVLQWMVVSLYRIALRECKGIFFQNPDDAQFFMDNNIIDQGQKCHLVNGSGVDVDYFEPAPFPPMVIFLMTSRLLRDKGVREYVGAARVIRKKYPEVRCMLVGWLDPNPSGISGEELQCWVREGVVDYLGVQKDIRPALSSCSVFVLPSYREGTPRSVLEAMAMGRPIITTDAPGCRETVANGDNGFLVPVKNAEALAEAMEKMILQPELIGKMGKRSREIAEEKYDVRKVNAVILHHMGLSIETAL